MRNGWHTLKSGFSADYDNPTTPRRHSFDNGDYTQNFMIRDIQLIPQNNNRTAGAADSLDNVTIFFVIATTELGAVPQTAIGGDQTVGNYDLRLSDNRQIAWGVLESGGSGYHKVIIDPGHIIVDDIYVNAWSFTTAGGIIPLNSNLGYMITCESLCNTGTEGLLYQAQQSAVE